MPYRGLCMMHLIKYTCPLAGFYFILQVAEGLTFIEKEVDNPHHILTNLWDRNTSDAVCPLAGIRIAES